MHRAIVVLLLLAPVSWAQAPEPLRVFLLAGEETPVQVRAQGVHARTRFLEEWSRLLSGRGCTVQGGPAFPGAAELAVSDVLVLYGPGAAALDGDERARLERYLAGGGGLVLLHDALRGDDPAWLRGVAGGAFVEGRSQSQEGELGLVFLDREHPITRGVASFDLTDESYSQLDLDPRAHVLASAFQTPFDVTPEMWVFESAQHRAFVTAQGHAWSSFAHPAWRTLLLRGIAWAGRREADLLVTSAEAAALRYPPGGPRAPDEAAGALVVHPDFTLSLVASEPLVVNPISLDWDARGRMWVALTPGYPDRQETSGMPAHDALVILDDRDGDGRADERQVFADGLDLVTSLVFHEDGVIVAQAPEILLLRDVDGDDRADQRVVLYRGFGHADTHAVISNLRLGFDGWIYGTQGYSGNDSRHVLDRHGVDHGAIGNGIFRFRPDGGAIEMVASFATNTWGLDFRWDDELFFTLANGSHLCHLVLPDRALEAGRIAGATSWVDVTDHEAVVPLRGRERLPYQQIDHVGGFTAASGSCLYGGGAWPADFDGDHFVCEPTVNLVHHDSLEPAGVTFRATRARAAEFLAASDLWFRPVHLRVGPDGALYLLDFYGQAVVHNDTRGPPHGPTNAALRPDRDHEHGRIWRVQHRSARALVTTPLATDESGLVAELEQPNLWRRMSAQRLLCEHELAPGTVDALVRSALSADEPWTRLHALWILAQRAPERFSALVPSALRDPHAAVRRAALRASAGLTGFDLARALPRPEALLDERDARTALFGLLAMRTGLPDAGHHELLARAATSGDPWRRSAVLAIACEDPLAFAQAAVAAPASPELSELARAVGASIARRGALRPAVEVVTQLGERGGAAPGVCLAMLDELGRHLDPALVPWPSPRIDRSLLRLLTGDALEVALAALPLAERWSREAKVAAARAALGGRLEALVTDTARPIELRLTSLTMLLSLPARRASGIPLAASFLGPKLAPEVQLGVIDALSQLADVAAARELCARYEELSHAVRERAFLALVARADWTGALLDALEQGTVRAADLGAQGLHRLRNHPDEGTRARARALLERSGAAENADKQALLATLLPLVDRPGDRARGRAVFEQSCGNCHTARGAVSRGGVGPDLSGIGAQGARSLLPTLIDPNRVVEPAFLEYVAETVDGALVDGVLVRETASAIVLRSSGGERELERADIASLRSTGRSPMPTGFESLGAEALSDLIAFLAGDFGGYRLIDLRAHCTSSTARGLYDTRRDPAPMRLRSHGVVAVRGVPFEILDPAQRGEQRNALTLRGGLIADWESHNYPQRIEIPLGFALRRLHVLGGIAAWGHPSTPSRAPAVRLTWRYADGTSEEHTLQDGLEFADWIARHDVPGSTWVDLLQADSAGQVRTFSVAPARSDEPVLTLVLESLDNHLAPTFLALTAELAGAVTAPAVSPAGERALDVLVFGGGSSHDFARWFARDDVRTLAARGRAVGYSEDPAELARLLASRELDALVLCNNQPLADPALRTALFELVAGGGGLVLVHAATWYNWADWPEYNRELVGGGAQSHEAYGEFTVRALEPAHALLAGVPESFPILDELYRLELDDASANEVLAQGTSLTGEVLYPVLWTRTHGRGRIVGLTLGHDGGAHQSSAYRALLANAVEWVIQDGR